MNNHNIFPDGGQLIIEMPGRGVSLQRVGKSGRKCGHRVGKTTFNFTAGNQEEPPIHTDRRPTVMRAGFEITREIEAIQTKCHQIIEIRPIVMEGWFEPFPDEYVWKTIDTPEKMIRTKVFEPKYSAIQRFNVRLDEYARYFCEQAFISPNRCSWQFKAH